MAANGGERLRQPLAWRPLSLAAQWERVVKTPLPPLRSALGGLPVDQLPAPARLICDVLFGVVAERAPRIARLVAHSGGGGSVTQRSEAVFQLAILVLDESLASELLDAGALGALGALLAAERPPADAAAPERGEAAAAAAADDDLAVAQLAACALATLALHPACADRLFAGGALACVRAGLGLGAAALVGARAEGADGPRAQLANGIAYACAAAAASLACWPSGCAAQFHLLAPALCALLSPACATVSVPTSAWLLSGRPSRLERVRVGGASARAILNLSLRYPPVRACLRAHGADAGLRALSDDPSLAQPLRGVATDAAAALLLRPEEAPATALALRGEGASGARPTTPPASEAAWPREAEPSARARAAAAAAAPAAAAPAARAPPRAAAVEPPAPGAPAGAPAERAPAQGAAAGGVVAAATGAASGASAPSKRKRTAAEGQSAPKRGHAGGAPAAGVARSLSCEHEGEWRRQLGRTARRAARDAASACGLTAARMLQRALQEAQRALAIALLVEPAAARAAAGGAAALHVAWGPGVRARTEALQASLAECVTIVTDATARATALAQQRLAAKAAAEAAAAAAAGAAAAGAAARAAGTGAAPATALGASDPLPLPAHATLALAAPPLLLARGEVKQPCAPMGDAHAQPARARPPRRARSAWRIGAILGHRLHTHAEAAPHKHAAAPAEAAADPPAAAAEAPAASADHGQGRGQGDGDGDGGGADALRRAPRFFPSKLTLHPPSPPPSAGACGPPPPPPAPPPPPPPAPPSQQFLVRWVGRGAPPPSWEECADIESPSLVAAYLYGDAVAAACEEWAWRLWRLPCGARGCWYVAPLSPVADSLAELLDADAASATTPRAPRNWPSEAVRFTPCLEWGQGAKCEDARVRLARPTPSPLVCVQPLPRTHPAALALADARASQAAYDTATACAGGAPLGGQLACAYGAFASLALPAHAWVCDYGGLVKRQKKTIDRSCYLMELAADAQRDLCLDVDAAVAGSEARMINDFTAIGPSANVVAKVHHCPETGEVRIAILTTRALDAGAELLLDYGVGFIADWKEVDDEPTLGGAATVWATAAGAECARERPLGDGAAFD